MAKRAVDAGHFAKVLDAADLLEQLGDHELAGVLRTRAAKLEELNAIDQTK